MLLSSLTAFPVRLAIFEVDNIKPITWRSDAFDNLVLEKQEKDLLLALIHMKKDIDFGGSGSDDQKFDDFITGKGKRRY